MARGATRTSANQEIFARAAVVDPPVQITALDRLGEADDVAEVVRFLASESARWITGQVIDASGGPYLGPRFQRRIAWEWRAGEATPNSQHRSSG